MKRSEINQAIAHAISFVEGRGIALPPFAHWGVAQWEDLKDSQRELVDNMLGWDVTDFGSDDFAKIGLTIFTFRNGNFKDKQRYPKAYAEKLLMVGDGQVLPYHFHWSKMEDIINRGGGNLIVTLYNADENDDFADTDVHVTLDGEQVSVPAGGTVKMLPGQSITLLPRQYHSWVGEPGTGDVMLFEVSSVNDDNVDNRFHSAKLRLPVVEEDEPATHLMFADYAKHVKR
ncbi:D-lyxose/D-mannose family sugar isomerase [Eubacteriales bacterium OttesenSCG-928-N13]|nr:D-lyxose/D-mannose family sugar isomerase [Eubacteriales bacterium OttesenSCG-928-N13]